LESPAASEANLVLTDLPKQTFVTNNIGANHGGSTRFFPGAVLKLFIDVDKVPAINTRTIGIDIDHKKVLLARAANVDCVQAGALKLTRESLHKVCGRKVKGATMWHVLEHMPSCDIAQNVFQNVAI